MKYKKCPICELNNIKEDQDMCIVCANKNQTRTRVDPKTRILRSFDKDYNHQHLRLDKELSYREVEALHGIQISGFGRGINETKEEVVLISTIRRDGERFVYHDKWTKAGDYIYSGEGKLGNQKLNRGNQAIVDTQTNGKKIHLYVKFDAESYYYQGEFYLVSYCTQTDLDENGCSRDEYKFTIRRK